MHRRFWISWNSIHNNDTGIYLLALALAFLFYKWLWLYYLKERLENLMGQLKLLLC